MKNINHGMLYVIGFILQDMHIQLVFITQLYCLFLLAHFCAYYIYIYIYIYI